VLCCQLVGRVLLLSIVMMLGGCADYPPELVPPVPDRSSAPELYQPLPPATFTIAPGDKLVVNSYFHPAVKQAVTVQPDGLVSLLLVGTVAAAGKTPEELAKELKRGYDKYLENAEITVTIDESPGLAVYVGGEVAKPAMLPLRGEITLLQSIAQAGGFLVTANKEQVLILRENSDGRFRAMQANAEQMLRNEADEIRLRRHDVVYVPKSAIAKVDQFVDQYLGQVVPRWVVTSFGFSYLLNGGATTSPTVITGGTR
jgi:protein involved in polysaccharide export with SLBB domain